MDESVSERGGLAPEPASAFSIAARELAELLAERLDLTLVRSRLELVFENGRRAHIWRHERIGATSLGSRSPPPRLETSA